MLTVNARTLLKKAGNISNGSAASDTTGLVTQRIRTGSFHDCWQADGEDMSSICLVNLKKLGKT